MSDGAKIVAFVVIMVIGIITGADLLSASWDRIDADKNAFAKNCNDRGGVAHFGPDARQCIGATLKKDDAS